MARPKNPVPTYRRHKQSGQAVVTVTVNGTRKDILLGAYDSAESRDNYRRVLADLAAGKLWAPAPTDLTVNELCLRFWKHAADYYRDPDTGGLSSEGANYKPCVRVWRGLLGDTPAADFGPAAFKRVRDAMVAKGWSRPYVNAQAARVKRVVRWAVENELLPADRWHALQAVRGLAAGRTAAPETAPVTPVPDADVRAVLPHVGPTVRAMVEVQSLTGMRPGEVTRLRPADLDRAGDVWVYRPERHKNKHRGKPRVIHLGPRSQEILKRFEPADPDGYYFSPRREVERVRAEKAAARKTPRFPSHMRRNAAKRKADPKRAAADRYTTGTYANAVARGCDRAGVEVWRPNRVRHAVGTDVRERFGIEAAQAVLGHERISTTEIYAEKVAALARKVAAEVG